MKRTYLPLACIGFLSILGCSDQVDSQGTTSSTGSHAGGEAGMGGSGGSGGSAGSAGSGGSVSSGCPQDNDDWTVGLVHCDQQASVGYTLFSPTPSQMTYLIDVYGRLVQSWQSQYRPGQSVYLLENGELLRTGSLGQGANQVFQAGGAGGRVQRFSWEGALLWDWLYSSDAHLSHHDVEPLPNGNFLVLVWEKRSAAEAIAAGRDPAKLSDDSLWNEQVLEIKPSGSDGAEIVWEWNAWDHLVQDFDSTKSNFGSVENAPQLIDINFLSQQGNQATGADWLHFNSVAYDETLDQIVLSSRSLNEIYVIDHSTTTAEAASHTGGSQNRGGDILYRWGNPQSYRAGTASDRKLFGQHDAQWITPGLPGAGDILIFNNGPGRPDGNYSTVEQISPPVAADGSYTLTSSQAYGPSDMSWHYEATPPNSVYADRISGTQRLSNGNTLVIDGPKGIIFEVADSGETVWRYINPVTGAGPLSQGDSVPMGMMGANNGTFKSRRYAPDFPGLAGKNLTPGDYLELPAP